MIDFLYEMETKVIAMGPNGEFEGIVVSRAERLGLDHQYLIRGIAEGEPLREEWIKERDLRPATED